MNASALALPVAVLAAVLPVAFDGGLGPEPEPGYRILVSNDDGIDSPALAALVAALSEQAEVVVCAPDGNRSGSSQSVAAMGAPMRVREAEVEGAVRAVAVGGTPADAVCFGLLELGRGKPFDLVVSGINQGANVGDLAHYSGTVGAAMEAAFRGVPAVAVSQGGRDRDWSFAASFTARFVAELRRHEPRPGTVYNLNVPSARAGEEPKPAVRAAGGSFLQTTGWEVVESGDGGREARARIAFRRQAPPGTDTEAFLAGRVTIAPLRFDWTDREALADLAGWDLGRAPGR
ncbi:MAG: 5'/3'-nucleotidase SurE [Planctomycetota bacterium]|nr:MAG: 5'/3'-nucleotidase SurE [Planctomycetota bacterium]